MQDEIYEYFEDYFKEKEEYWKERFEEEKRDTESV